MAMKVLAGPQTDCTQCSRSIGAVSYTVRDREGEYCSAACRDTAVPASGRKGKMKVKAKEFGGAPVQRHLCDNCGIPIVFAVRGRDGEYCSNRCFEAKERKDDMANAKKKKAKEELPDEETFFEPDEEEEVAEEPAAEEAAAEPDEEEKGKPVKKTKAKKSAAKAKPTAPAKKAPKGKAPKEKAAPKKADGGKENLKETVIAMLRAKGGTTIDALMKATGWQAHSVRGLLSTLKSKAGIKVVSAKEEGGKRTYSAK
jgi:hypothetical protein